MAIHFLFDKLLSMLWQIYDIIGLILINANGQIFKNNNLTIWSHCFQVICGYQLSMVPARGNKNTLQHNEIIALGLPSE